MEYIKVGKIVNTFGIKGELKIYSYTDFEEERFCEENVIYIKYKNGYEAHEIETMRYHKNMILISFKDEQDINLVEKYKECDLFVDADDIEPLAEGEYYFFELENMEVYDEAHQYIGKVIEVVEGLANNNLRVKKENNNTVLIPYVPAFIMSVDKAKNEIIVHVIEGLL